MNVWVTGLEGCVKGAAGVPASGSPLPRRRLELHQQLVVCIPGGNGSKIKLHQQTNKSQLARERVAVKRLGECIPHNICLAIGFSQSGGMRGGGTSLRLLNIIIVL